MKPRTIELRIEELTLHGFGPGDRSRIGQSVERQLGRLFAEEGVPRLLTNNAETARVDGGSFELGPGAGAEAIGTHVARAVYEGLGA